MYNSTKPYRRQILDLIEKTWETPYVHVTKGIYPVIIRKYSCHEIDHTDGIGTKGIYHWEHRTFRNAVLDALAMNLNDLALARAVPYKLQNHIFIPEDDKPAIIEIAEALTDECIKRKIAITGGETSIHNNLNGLEVSLTVSGFIKSRRRNRFEIGDYLIGIKSNGLHSNGFTKVRELFHKEFREEFVEPTRIYFDEIDSLNERFHLNGMMHITGGAFTKLKDLLVEADLELRRNYMPEPQQIFKDLYNKGISDEEMYKIFNCGIGFILSVPKKETDKIMDKLKDSYIIGDVVPGKRRIIIESAFSDKILEF